ncbi:hypothetical protein Fraau_1348 [Frateuria aurantia DSM 6220]|uniref:Uncharacterized protein n=1 Tax=Frateuria aurantia (strain ATCC 33424 / DSM 6220 / KCTC 2777 / LMG 1558 / NBRC 3245 / NCIMB 13370) TaxID=767434 RepID=H8L5I0_FRAAD|nr:hypothetical protein Fraau_1348 [Frateuria aurantia DSM 6220]
MNHLVQSYAGFVLLKTLPIWLALFWLNRHAIADAEVGQSTCRLCRWSAVSRSFPGLQGRCPLTAWPRSVCS